MEEDILLKKKNKAQRDGNAQALADVQKKLGDLFYGKKCYEDALEAYKGQLQACECLSDKLNCAIAHRMIGEVQADIGNFKEALSHQNLYLDIAKELQDLIEEQRAFATLGRTYLLVADNYVKESEMDKKLKVLKDAKKAFSKSIKLCDKLENKIDISELMMMRARLLLNLGLVLEQQKDTEQALNLIKQAASLCRKHNLHEDLNRSNIALAGINERLGCTETAIKNLDEAAKVDDIYLKADARLLKAELLLRLGEWIEAKNILHILYKSKKLQEVVRLSVIKLLKIAVLLCKNEDKLLTEDNLSVKEKLYESMGDAAIAVRSLDKAEYYYRNMLICAEQAKSNQIGAALTSLAQTLRDAGKFQEAIPYARRELKFCKDAKETCNSALYLAGLLVDANSPDKEIRQMFQTALASAKDSGDPGLERTVAKDFLEYLKDLDEMDIKEIESLNERLDNLPDSMSDEAECEEESETPDIGEDICLDDLSDTESEISNYPPRNVSKFISTRRPRCIVKKNEKGESQLHVACIKGNIGAVEKLLDEQHPTAVRDHCGWTPLHEASNHGFVEIVRLMVRAGADVNDPGGVNCDGVTALHDAAANGHVAVVNLLLDSGANANLLTRGGESALDCLEQWRERVDKLSLDELKEFDHTKRRLSGLITVRTKKKSKKEKGESRWNALVDDDEEAWIDKSISMESWAKPEKISAGEDYKRTIASMQHPGRSNLQSTKPPRLPKITAPLIDSEEMLVDDWLEEDIATKRQDKFFSSSGILSTAQPSKRKSKNDSDNEIERQVEKSTKRQKTSSTNQFHQDEFVSVHNVSENSCDSSTSDHIIDRFNEVWPRRKKPRQTSLLKQGFSKILDSRSPSPSNLISEEAIYPPANVKTTRRSWDSGTVSETLHLDIAVDEEAFELKLHSRDLKKTMSDIEELIRHKFEAKTGCRPKLRFNTVEGIALAPEVTLEEIVREKRKLKLLGEITKNDLPPIVDRYKKVCETYSVEVTDSMIKSLRSCDNTSAFRLNADSVLEELEPLIKCLHYQKNLQILNLSGATLFESGELLNHVICQLSNLCELHLQCCDIDLECLNKIDKFPSQIRVLDLSYNPLGGDSQKKLHELIEPLKRLQTLDLRYCELTDFAFSYTNHALVNLDISWNPIGGDGAANFLQRQLLSLNLSNTQNIQSNCINVIDKIFFKDSSKFSFSALESLDLSSCQATDLDVEQILSQTPNLMRINLSNNINVTKTSLCGILGKKPTLSYINLSGCRLINGFPDSNIKIFSPQICTLFVHMTVDVLDAWEKLWKGKGYSKKLPHGLITFKPL